MRSTSSGFTASKQLGGKRRTRKTHRKAKKSTRKAHRKGSRKTTRKHRKGSRKH